MTEWSDLTAELDLWADAGTAATFWWRDDDAVEATPQLERLLSCAQGVPLALAVIPGLADRSLADRLAASPTVTVLQHGWRHVSHSPDTLNEYPGMRADAEVAAEFEQGRTELERLFGSRSLPVFVPPWHGFDDRFLGVLSGAGLQAISRKGPRPVFWAAERVMQANAHVSPIRWTTPPSFAEDAVYLSQFVDHLRGRRLGRYDPGEATGLLTHHLAQDDASWLFIARLLEIIKSHPAAAWRDARDLFLAP